MRLHCNVRESIEAEARTGSECEHRRGAMHRGTSKAGDINHGKKGGRTLAMFDTLAVFQLAMFWLKAVALWNIFQHAVTLAVFHEPMLPLKAVALWNMPCMVVTLAVFHLPMLPLKAVAPRNMLLLYTALAVFHAPMLPLKAVAP